MEALTPLTIGEGAIQIGRDVDQVTTLSGSSWEQTFELDVRTPYRLHLLRFFRPSERPEGAAESTPGSAMPKTLLNHVRNILMTT